MNNKIEPWNEWRVLEIGDRLSPRDIAAYDLQAAELGVNAWEIAILESIWYEFGQVSSADLLADRAFGIYRDRNPLKAAAAVQRCFDDGFIQHLTTEFLTEMQLQLDAGGYLQPGGLVGCGVTEFAELEGLISFTQRGVDVFHKWIGFDPATSQHWTHGLQLESPFEIYGTSEEWCEHALPNYSTEYEVEGPAVPIGRWCDRWWNRFESGYRLRYSITNQAGS